MLDYNQVMQVSVAQRRVGLAHDVVAKGLDELQDHTLSLEQLYALQRIISDDSLLAAGYTKRKNSRHAEESDHDMCSEDQYLRAIAAVPKVRMKLKVLTAFKEAPSQEKEFQAQLIAVSAAVRRVMQGDAMHTVCVLVLQLGNFLNAGVHTTAAQGFSLASLANLGATKTTVGGQTLLDVVIKYGEQRVAGFAAELSEMHRLTESIKKVNTDMLCDAVDGFFRQVSKAHKFVVEEYPEYTHIVEPLDQMLHVFTDLNTEATHLREELSALCERYATGGESAGQILESIRQFTSGVRKSGAAAPQSASPSTKLVGEFSQGSDGSASSGGNSSNSGASTLNFSSADATLEQVLTQEVDSIFSADHAASPSVGFRGRRGGRVGSRRRRLQGRQTVSRDMASTPSLVL